MGANRTSWRKTLQPSWGNPMKSLNYPWRLIMFYIMATSTIHGEWKTFDVHGKCSESTESTINNSPLGTIQWWIFQHDSQRVYALQTYLIDLVWWLVIHLFFALGRYQVDLRLTPDPSSFSVWSERPDVSAIATCSWRDSCPGILYDSVRAWNMLKVTSNGMEVSWNILKWIPSRHKLVVSIPKSWSFMTTGWWLGVSP